MMPITILDDEGGEIRLPVAMEVCDTCNGTGTQALHGLEVTDECREDPEFAEDYFAGAYDTVCERCNGRNVVEVADYDAMSPKLRKRWEQWCDDAAEDAMAAAERRAGC